MENKTNSSGSKRTSLYPNLENHTIQNKNDKNSDELERINQNLSQLDLNSLKYMISQAKGNLTRNENELRNEFNGLEKELIFHKDQPIQLYQIRAECQAFFILASAC